MKNALLVFSFLFFIALYTQGQNYYWIAFSDKYGTEYTLENPSEYLSERALERRVKQNIQIDSLDLPVSKIYIDSVLTLDVEYVHSSKWLNGMTVKTDLDSLGNLVGSWEFVYDVQLTKTPLETKSAKVKFDEVITTFEPIDSSYYGKSVHQVGMLNGQYLHNDNFKGQGMQIAVIDAGFINADELSAFDSLWQNNQILGTRDFLQLSTGIFDSGSDYHGMSVLSCMGANIPGQLIGTAPKASYWLIRSERVGEEFILEEDNWVAAAEFADSVGVDIINSSLGYYEFDDTSTNHTYADMDGKTTRVTRAANIAAARGMLVFASAGNERDDPWQRIIAPSDGDGVIGVGAVDRNLQPARFTSAGPAADGDIKPNVSAMGVQTIVQNRNGSIGMAYGTSFASPVMAGMAACLWQKNSTKSADEIKQALEESCHQYENPDSLVGYGVPDMQIADELLNPISAPMIAHGTDCMVYPNPFSDRIVVQFKGINNRGDAEFKLISMGGLLLKSWRKEIDGNVVLTEIPEKLNGIFFLRIETKQYTQTIKLLKN